MDSGVGALHTNAMIRSLFLCVLAVLLVTNLGCKRRDRGGELEKDYERPLAAGEDGIVRLDPADYPRFTLRDSNRDDLLLGIERSLNYSGKLGKESFPHGRGQPSTSDQWPGTI